MNTCRRYRVVVAAADELYGDAMVAFVKQHLWPERTEFHVVSVLEPNLLDNPLLLPELAETIAGEDRLAARMLLNYLARELYSGVPHIRVRRYLGAGNPKKEILQLARDLDADLIIMGSHGRSGLQRLLLGSVAGSVVAASPCSTVIIRIPPAELLDYDSIQLSEDDLPEEMKAELGMLTRG